MADFFLVAPRFASRAGLTFTDFVVNVLPIVVVLLVVFVGLAWLLFRKELVYDADRARRVMALNEREAIRDIPLLAKSLGVIALVLAGMIAYTGLPIKQFPNVEFPVVAVTVTQSGAAPGEMETQITRPVEDAMSGLAGVRNIQSTVTQGVSTTALEFELGEDVEGDEDSLTEIEEFVRVGALLLHAEVGSRHEPASDTRH